LVRLSCVLQKAVVLKLGVATLLRVAKYFRASIRSIYLRFIVVCNSLGSRKFENILKRVAIQKSLRTPDIRVGYIRCYPQSFKPSTHTINMIFAYCWKVYVHSSISLFWQCNCICYFLPRLFNLSLFTKFSFTQHLLIWFIFVRFC